jgi:chaperonin GroEL
MSKQIVFSSEARVKLLEGVKKLSDAVVSTLGPSGRNVIIQKSNEYPASTKDGVTVAKAVVLEDQIEAVGAQIVKQASIKTADQAGDGTTTSTLLAYTIASTAMNLLSDKLNPVDIKRGIDQGVRDVVGYLKTKREEILAEDQLRQVATISANNDPEVGELIASAMDKVGVDGVVTIEESRTGETYLETVEGMQFDRGYKSPYFVTDNNTMSAILTKPLILITDKKVTAIKEFLPILEACSTQNRSLLIIADDVDGEALSTLVVNKMRNILQVVAVKAPGFGDKKKAMLEDIATLTGGTVISQEKGMRMEKFNSEWLGDARKVVVTKDTTTIIDGKGNQETLEERVASIKEQIDNSKSPYEIEQLQDRLGRLIGGVAIVYVGGMTEVEMKEKKDRVEDALHATKAALEEGILPGGGSALLNAHNYLNTIEHTFANADQAVGYGVLQNSLLAPFIKILDNAGYSQAQTEEIREELKSKDFWFGYNPRKSEIVNMFEEGIVDPLKVTRLALENAASVAGTLLLTECVISDLKEEKKEEFDFNNMM